MIVELPKFANHIIKLNIFSYLFTGIVFEAKHDFDRAVKYKFV